MLTIAIFCIGYLLISLEHLVKINKTAIALLTGVLCWLVYALSGGENLDETLFHHLGKSAEILFFLLGAMTIVELVDAHEGFNVITQKIKTPKAEILLILLATITFFLSAILDNLTTAIVMISLIRKIISEREKRLIFASIIIIAANAGGAWSPIGDVTTTMLWIGGQISAFNTIKSLFLPSLVSLLIPTFYFYWKLKGQKMELKSQKQDTNISPTERNIMFGSGLGILLAVPIFKTITHLPPYMGILLGLGIIWVVGEILHKEKDEEERQPLSAAHALSRIDSGSILFFLGILLAIGVLESTHTLKNMAHWLNELIPNQSLIVMLIGLASAVVDNVPLVAASIGMYDLQSYPLDSPLWQFLAYCAGTGGSILIIGSAAGVAVMGMEKIDFLWYLKHISFITLLGYLAGAGVYLVICA